jgi:hypothetical protein
MLRLKILAGATLAAALSTTAVSAQTFEKYGEVEG